MIKMKEEIRSREEIEAKKDHRLQEEAKGIEERQSKIEIEIIDEVAEEEVAKDKPMKEESQCTELELDKRDQDLHLTNLLGNGNTETLRDLFLTMI